MRPTQDQNKNQSGEAGAKMGIEKVVEEKRKRQRGKIWRKRQRGKIWRKR
jgi:hypothetical protein